MQRSRSINGEGHATGKWRIPVIRALGEASPERPISWLEQPFVASSCPSRPSRTNATGSSPVTFVKLKS